MVKKAPKGVLKVTKHGKKSVTVAVTAPKAVKRRKASSKAPRGSAFESYVDEM